MKMKVLKNQLKANTVPILPISIKHRHHHHYTKTIMLLWFLVTLFCNLAILASCKYVKEEYSEQKLPAITTTGTNVTNSNLTKTTTTNLENTQSYTNESLLEEINKPRNTSSTVMWWQILKDGVLSDSYSTYKELENRSQLGEKCMDQLKKACVLFADIKSDELSHRLAFVEADLEKTKGPVRSNEAKFMKHEEEFKVVSDSPQPVEDCEEVLFNEQVKVLETRLKEAEERAKIAERNVLKLQREVDRLDEELGINRDKYLAKEMDSTFVKLAGY